MLKERGASAVTFDTRAELAGLSDAEIKNAADAAAKAGKPGKFVVELVNTTGQPVLTDLTSHASRMKVMAASLARGSRGGEFDNRAVVATLARKRAERAALLGYPTHAAFQLAEQTVGSVDVMNKMLAQMAAPAVANARKEGRAAAGDDRRRQGRLQAGGGRLGLLRREAAQGAVRVRRVAAQAVLRARPRAVRRRVLRGQQAVRPDVQGTPRPAGVRAQRARVRRVRQGRHAARDLHRRLLRALRTRTAAPG